MQEETYRLVHQTQRLDLAKRLGTNGFIAEIPILTSQRFYRAVMPKNVRRDLQETGRIQLREAGYTTGDRFFPYKIIPKIMHHELSGLLLSCSLPRRNGSNILNIQPDFLSILTESSNKFLTYRAFGDFTKEESSVLRSLFSEWYKIADNFAF